MHNHFKNKRVFLTGHTGFKGAWMLQILHHFGAEVIGYSLAPENENDLFQQINGATLCASSIIADIREEKTLSKYLNDFQPDYVFHLAAQSLVRRSYSIPSDTFSTNVMGTISVLEAMRKLEKPCIGIMVTTDKVYENNEQGIAFKEDEKLGGYDPYSASKAATEIAIASYRNSFFNPEKYKEHKKAIASVRAGNVIGGGDYSLDRIIPDITRAIENNEAVVLRSPKAVRPWQHVLEPIMAYLYLAAKLNDEPQQLASSFNIGPDKEDVLEVRTVTQKFIEYYGKGTYSIAPNAPMLHEANLLMLDNAKIKNAITWQPILNADTAIKLTAEWYADKENTATEKCLMQIEEYLSSFTNKVLR